MCVWGGRDWREGRYWVKGDLTASNFLASLEAAKLKGGAKGHWYGGPDDGFE